MPTSDLQHIAQLLVKTQRGDQVTRSEMNRLEDIADNGYTTGRVAVSSAPVVVDPTYTRVT